MMKTLFEQIIEKHFPEMTSADGVVDHETKMDLLIMERMFDAISEDYHLIDKVQPPLKNKLTIDDLPKLN